MNKITIFGAGNIGRSFIGNIFSSNGTHVTFVDANKDLVDNLNSRGKYRILIKENNQPNKEILVENIEALHSSETDRIVESLNSCDICSTSVGQGALPKIISVLAKGILIRIKNDRPPLDIIIAENIRSGAEYFKARFKELGLSGEEAGLVETSIGKMVPIMLEKDLADDPLVLYAEAYNTLILDSKGFKNRVPVFPEIKAVDNIAAWVDRKLFIHNLGHAAAAYFGYEKYPDRLLIADVLLDENIRKRVKSVMLESAGGLAAEYPDDFSEKDLEDHIGDLLFRFQNKALGDTVYRVGRDLSRKLSKNDRILGSALLCIKHNLPYSGIVNVFKAALKFGAAAPDGKCFSKDLEFLKRFGKEKIETALVDLCGLDSRKDVELIDCIRR